MLTFIAYFVLMFLLFLAFWKCLDRFFGTIERKHEREFREKVDRYRRGNR